MNDQSQPKKMFLNAFLIILFCVPQVIWAHVYTPFERVHSSMQLLTRSISAQEHDLRVSVAFSTTFLRMKTSTIELSANKSIDEVTALAGNISKLCEKKSQTILDKYQPILESIDAMILELRNCGDADIRQAYASLVTVRAVNEGIRHQIHTNMEFSTLVRALNTLQADSIVFTGRVNTYIDKINQTNCPEVTEGKIKKAIAEARSVLSCDYPSVQ